MTLTGAKLPHGKEKILKTERGRIILQSGELISKRLWTCRKMMMIRFSTTMIVKTYRLLLCYK
jgi:hypothetical protein